MIPQCKTMSTAMFHVFTQIINCTSALPTNRIMSLANENKIELFNLTSIQFSNRGGSEEHSREG